MQILWQCVISTSHVYPPQIEVPSNEKEGPQECFYGKWWTTRDQSEEVLMVQHPIAVWPSLIAQTGDHTAAVVLSQIMYWHSGRLRVKRKGTLWLVKSRADMCKETGITLDQYKRVMPLLKRKGFITCERGLFQNKVTPFIRLTEVGQSVMVGLRMTKPPNPLVAHDTNQLVASDTNLNTESTYKEYDQKTGASASGGGEQEQGAAGVGKKVVGEVGEGVSMKATDVLKNQKVGVSSSLGAHWKAKMALESGAFQHPLTAKEAGQLKQLSKYLGSVETTKATIDYVIDHWATFAHLAGNAAGLFTVPSEPHIGFLLKHHAVAVNLQVPPVTPSTQPEPPPPVQSIAGGTDEQPHTLTSKELTEMLDGLETP
jgi:hypothetical protein